MSECNFHVGQKVVCIDDVVRTETPPAPANVRHRGLNGLKRGETYIVRSVFFCEVWRCVLIRVEGIKRGNTTLVGYAYEAGFCPTRFRPVKSVNTDISIFKAMLNPSKEQVSA